MEPIPPRDGREAIISAVAMLSCLFPARQESSQSEQRLEAPHRALDTRPPPPVIGRRWAEPSPSLRAGRPAACNDAATSRFCTDALPGMLLEPAKAILDARRLRA
jgi:hypothetical protein